VHGRETGQWHEADLAVAHWLQHTSRDGDMQLHVHSQIAHICTTRSWERSSSGTTRTTDSKKRRSEATGACSKISRLARLSISVQGVDDLLTFGQHPEHLIVAAQQGIGCPGQAVSDHGEQAGDLGFDGLQLTLEFLPLLDHGQSLPAATPALHGHK
jgi:hypothetical protein